MHMYCLDAHIYTALCPTAGAVGRETREKGMKANLAILILGQVSELYRQHKQKKCESIINISLSLMVLAIKLF